jgi:hypothetical protein
MKNALLTLATMMTLSSFAQANDVITQVLRFAEDLQITVSTRSYCNNPKGTLKLIAVSQKAAVYSLELTPINRMLCAPGNKEAVVEVQVPADFRSEQLVIVSGANAALTEEE